MVHFLCHVHLSLVPKYLCQNSSVKNLKYHISSLTVGLELALLLLIRHSLCPEEALNSHMPTN